MHFAQFRRIIYGIFSTLDNIIHHIFQFVHQKIDFTEANEPLYSIFHSNAFRHGFR